MKGWKIFVLALIVYGVSVFGEFIQDDTKVIVNDPEMGKVSPLVATFVRPYYYMDGGNAGVYRPITSFSLYLNALITGNGAWGFRLVNVFLYGGVCVLVFSVLKLFTTEKIAFWSALIFLVLPIHTEAVNNIVGRAEILSLGFVLMAVLMQNKKEWEVSALMLLLAILSKETAIVGLPVLMYLLITSKEKREAKVGVSSFYVVVVISYILLRLMVLGTGGMGNNATIVENQLKFVTTQKRVMNAFALVPFGLGKVIFPLNLSYDYSFNQLKLATSWFDGRVLLGISLMLFSLGSLFTSLRNKKLWILGQAFFWGPIAITGNFLFPVGTIFGERLWFWPSLGVILMGISYVNLYRFRIMSRMMGGVRLPRRFHLLAMTALIGIIVLLAGRTLVRNIDWLSQRNLFLQDVKYAKDSVMVQSNAAAILLMDKEREKGKIYMENADKIYPKYPELVNNWGMYYLWKGDIKKGKEKLEECLKIKPSDYLCESNLKYANSLDTN